MIQNAGTSSGCVILRPRVGLLRTLGDELISSEVVALIELVKNAYDADATRVLVHFRGPLNPGEGSIDVIDNGHGMSLDTIRTAWMEPATLYRKQQKRSEGRRRRVLGEKGIGRFGASRLAMCLEVISRRAESDRETQVVFDWVVFDSSSEYLDQVRVPWRTREPEAICPGGVVQALWEDDALPPPDALTHGTILHMQGLRVAWDREQLKALRTGLSRLVSPFFEEEVLRGKDEFRVILDVPPPFDIPSGVVSPPEALKSPHYTLKASITSDGTCTAVLMLRGSEREEKLKRRLGRTSRGALKCGPCEVELRVWDRDRLSLSELASAYGSSLSDVRRDLNETSGISVYRDGFRVLPYGERGDDWLGLDARRVQNPTLRVSNNQIVGYVKISADANPDLRDQSNREGLVEGAALDDLREVVKEVLSELERKRYDVRRTEKIGRSSAGIFQQFDLSGIRHFVRDVHPADTRLKTLVSEKERELQTRIGEVKEVLARYHRLASLGQLIDTVLHDGRAPLAKIVNECTLALREMGREHNPSGLLNSVSQRLGVVKEQAGVLSNVFQRLEPFSGRRRGRPERVLLEDVIARSFSVLDSDIARLGVRIALPGSQTWVTADESELQQVLVNLLQNSLHWLEQVPRESREINVQLERGEDELQILFSDSGPGVDPDYRELIFNPYFSTKPNGVGLGLSIAGEIVTDYYGGRLELVDGGPLCGATFRITLRRRV